MTATGGSPNQTEATALDADVRELIDSHKIRKLLHHYARGIDRGDWALMRSCFTDNATDNHGVLQRPIDRFVDGARTLLQPFWGIMHFLGQVYVEIDGDRACSETYAVSFHRRHGDAGDEDTLTGLRYLDRLVRFGDGWKIAERITVHEWNTTVSAKDWLDAAAFASGRSDASDVLCTRVGWHRVISDKCIRRHRHGWNRKRRSSPRTCPEPNIEPTGEKERRVRRVKSLVMSTSRSSRCSLVCTDLEKESLRWLISK